MRTKPDKNKRPQELSQAQILNLLRELLPKLREKYGIQRLALYGSFAKARSQGQSDVDILVHLIKPLGFDFIALAFDLEKALGRKVDLTTFETLARSEANPRHQPIVRDIKKSLIYV
ncbi:nucleotidyltransferase family protein [Desulfobacca acetoxidans]